MICMQTSLSGEIDTIEVELEASETWLKIQFDLDEDMATELISQLQRCLEELTRRRTPLHTHGSPFVRGCRPCFELQQLSQKAASIREKDADG